MPDRLGGVRSFQFESLTADKIAELIDAEGPKNVVGEANGCNYCLSAHSLLGKGAGLSPAEIAAAREGASADPRIAEGLRFAQAIVADRGNVTDADLARVRAAGYSDGEIGEIVANVALNIFTNYFNQVAATAIDFPVVKAKVRQAA